MNETAIRLVKQKTETDCGIACVAMLLPELSYALVKKKLFNLQGWKKQTRQTYTKASELVPLCCSLGLEAELKKARGWEEISPVAIVGVNREEGYFHWVLSIKRGENFFIIDPAREEYSIQNGQEWADEEDGYLHSNGSTNYVSVNVSVTSILI